MSDVTRRVVIVGQRARGTPDFLVNDLPGTSGRLDVLLRCLRAGLMVSHGLRVDTVVYLVLAGGERPRTLRFRGAAARFLRPDERSLAILTQKLLATSVEGEGFVTVKPGMDIAEAGLDAVLADVGTARRLLLDEHGPDLRGVALGGGVGAEPVVLFVGDHLGFTDGTRAALLAAGAMPVSLGPHSLHADDAVAVCHNELDRRWQVMAGG